MPKKAQDTKEPKIAVSSRFDKSIFERLERLAEVDRRSNSDVIAQCVEDYLPVLEAQMRAKQKAVEELMAKSEPNPGRKLPSDDKGEMFPKPKKRAA